MARPPFCKCRVRAITPTMMKHIFIAATLLTAGCSGGAQMVDPIAALHADIVADYPTLSHIPREVVQKRLSQSPQSLVILDTRPRAEYDVSHITGAVQIDPDADAARLITALDVRGKDVVLYCSVGRRSSIVGDRTKAALLAAGATSVQNMEGGLFAWHNDGRPVVNAQGATKAIHPYDSFWGQLIKNRDAARYTP